MKRGSTEVETLKLNGWKVGTVLIGTESGANGWSQTDRIKITAIGKYGFLCLWDYGNTGEWNDERGSTTLTSRLWTRVIPNRRGKTTTTIERVLKYCNTHCNFTWKQFEKKFGPYPCTATNYLSQLVHAEYVDRYARGKYYVEMPPPVTMSTSQLKDEAKSFRKVV